MSSYSIASVSIVILCLLVPHACCWGPVSHFYMFNMFYPPRKQPYLLGEVSPDGLFAFMSSSFSYAPGETNCPSGALGEQLHDAVLAATLFQRARASGGSPEYLMFLLGVRSQGYFHFVAVLSDNWTVYVTHGG
jgi:hypothetical protein